MRIYDIVVPGAGCWVLVPGCKVLISKVPLSGVVRGIAVNLRVL